MFPITKLPKNACHPLIQFSLIFPTVSFIFQLHTEQLADDQNYCSWQYQYLPTEQPRIPAMVPPNAGLNIDRFYLLSRTEPWLFFPQHFSQNSSKLLLNFSVFSPKQSQSVSQVHWLMSANSRTPEQSIPLGLSVTLRLFTWWRIGCWKRLKQQRPRHSARMSF